MAGFVPIYLLGVPLTSYVTKESSVVQKLLETTISLLSSVTKTTITADRTIPALAALYTFATFAASGAWSVAGQASASKHGLDNNHPRSNVNSLTGLPLRLRSAHYNLMEMFPGWAIAAALAQTMAPSNQQVVNLLGLHVLAKLFLYYPSYVLDIAPTRSVAHLLATSSVVNVCWRLATDRL